MKRWIAFVVSFAFSTSLAFAQVTGEQRITATVTTDGPIFLSAAPAVGIRPLRTAAAGTTLRVIGEKDDWLQVEFNDPQYGARLGWIQKKFVKVEDPALRPMDLSVVKEEIKPAPAPAPGPRRQANVSAPVGAAASSQVIPQGKSRSRGFFVGVGLEGNGVVVEGSDEAESGSGFGVTVGYGFNRQVAIYGQISGANIDSSDGFGSYGLGHFDIGVRGHFRAPEKTVVPFIQVGLSGRAAALDFFGDRVETNGAGFAFGGGLNAHFTPAVAFTTHVVWSIGNMSNGKVNGVTVPLDSFGFGTARVHVGVVWFPQSK